VVSNKAANIRRLPGTEGSDFEPLRPGHRVD